MTDRDVAPLCSPCICVFLFVCIKSCAMKPPFCYISLFALKDLFIFFFMHRIATHHYDGLSSVTSECDWHKLDKPPSLIATVMALVLSRDSYNSFFLHFNAPQYIFGSDATGNILISLLVGGEINTCTSVWLLYSNFLLCDSSSFISPFCSVSLTLRYSRLPL